MHCAQKNITCTLCSDSHERLPSSLQPVAETIRGWQLQFPRGAPICRCRRGVLLTLPSFLPLLLPTTTHRSPFPFGPQTLRSRLSLAVTEKLKYRDGNSGKQVGKPERSVKNHAELRLARLNPPKSELRTLLHHCGPTQISELEQASGCRSWSVKHQFRVAVGPRLQTGHGTVQSSPLVLFIGHTSSLRNRASFTGFRREGRCARAQ